MTFWAFAGVAVLVLVALWVVSVIREQRLEREREAARRWLAKMDRARTFRAQDDHRIERPDVPRKSAR